MRQVLAMMALIVFTLILFGCAGVKQEPAAGSQSVSIQVTPGGYSPQVLEVVKGTPVNLNFQTGNSMGCAGDIEIPAFGIRQKLTPETTTAVKVVPQKAGDYIIRCSMNMFTTTLKVQ